MESPLPDPIVNAVKEYFKSNPNKKDSLDLWGKFEKIKSESRNDWGSKFTKDYKDKEKSGTYDDSAILEAILKITIEDKIDENHKKWVNEKVVEEKKKRKMSDEEIRNLQKEKHDENHDELNQAHLRPRHHRQTFVAIFEQHPFLLFYRV